MFFCKATSIVLVQPEGSKEFMTIKRNMVPLLGIAFVVAIAATGIFYGLFVGKIRAASDAQNQPVVAAARNLERGTVIKSADLKLIAWQSGAAPKGAFQAADLAVGKTVVSPVGEGELITAAKLAGFEASAGGLTIPAGMRAISVTVGESQGLMNFLRTGQRVDIQVVSARSSQDAELRAIIQNLEVLAIHQMEQGGGRPATTMLTILASPQDADRLALADSGARVRVLLRNSVDKEQGSRPGLAIAQLFNDRGQPIAAPHSPVAAQPRPAETPPAAAAPRRAVRRGRRTRRRSAARRGVDARGWCESCWCSRGAGTRAASRGWPATCSRSC